MENGEVSRELCVVGVAKCTRVGLNTSGYLACTDSIEECDVLTQDSLEIAFSESLRGSLPVSYPNCHIDESTNKYANTCKR
jgi:hypothetical protein